MIKIEGTIVIRTRTQEEVSTSDLVLLLAEPCYIQGLNTLVVGDGVTKLKDLPTAGGGLTDIGTVTNFDAIVTKGAYKGIQTGKGTFTLLVSVSGTIIRQDLFSSSSDFLGAQTRYKVGSQPWGSFPKLGFSKTEGENVLDFDNGFARRSIDFDRGQLKTGASTSVDWVLSRLKTSTGYTALDWENSQTFAPYTTTPSLDWSTRMLYDTNGASVVDWEMGKLGAIFNGVPAIDWNNGQVFSAYSEGNQAVLDWSSQFLADSKGYPSVYWDLRVLKDASPLGVESLDWNNRKMYDSNHNVSVLWDERKLLDSFGSVLVDWENNTIGSTPLGMPVINFTDSRISNSDGYPVIDWGSALLLDHTSNVTLGWANRQLYNSDGVSVDWGSRTMYDGSAKLAMNWEDRTLLGSEGKRSIDWKLRALHNQSDAVMFSYGSGIKFWTSATPVSAQPAAIANATNATDVITQLNSVLVTLRNYGLIKA